MGCPMQDQIIKLIVHAVLRQPFLLMIWLKQSNIACHVLGYPLSPPYCACLNVFFSLFF